MLGKHKKGKHKKGVMLWSLWRMLDELNWMKFLLSPYLLQLKVTNVQINHQPSAVCTIQNTDHSGILRDHQTPGDDYLMIGCVAGVMVTLVTEKNSSVV